MSAAAGSMMEGILAVERAAAAWTRRLSLLGGGLLLLVALVTVADALLRTFASRPLPGAFEATELLLAAVIFFALPHTGLTDGHVSVDMVTRRLPARGQHAILAINALVCAVVLGFVAWQMGSLAVEYARTARTTITTRIPIVPFIVPVTAAAGLAVLGFVVQAIGGAARAARPDLAPPPRESGR